MNENLDDRMRPALEADVYVATTDIESDQVECVAVVWKTGDAGEGTE